MRVPTSLYPETHAETRTDRLLLRHPKGKHRFLSSKLSRFQPARPDCWGKLQLWVFCLEKVVKTNESRKFFIWCLPCLWFQWHQGETPRENPWNMGRLCWWVSHCILDLKWNARNDVKWHVLFPDEDHISRWRQWLGGGNSNIFYSPLKLGKVSILTSIFQRGWNHQLDEVIFLNIAFYPKDFPKKMLYQCDVAGCSRDLDRYLGMSGQFLGVSPDDLAGLAGSINRHF